MVMSKAVMEMKMEKVTKQLLMEIVLMTKMKVRGKNSKNEKVKN